MTAWIVYSKETQEPILWKHYVPMFWYRNVAINEAKECGYITSGPKQDVIIKKVKIP